MFSGNETIAGFDEEDIDVEVQGETLTISGKRPNEASEGLVHQGLASRNFVRKFQGKLNLKFGFKIEI